MRRWIILFFLCFTFTPINGFCKSVPSNHVRIMMNTSMGDITLELDAVKAPITVKNFMQYVNSGFYNGTIFHRIIPNFMIQGGGFKPGMRKKTSGTPIKNEAANGLTNDVGTIAMARTSEPNSATAQFFINVNNNASLNHKTNSPGGYGYAVFGKVVAGMDVVNRIVAARTTSKNHYRNVPVNDILIKHVAKIK